MSEKVGVFVCIVSLCKACLISIIHKAHWLFSIQTLWEELGSRETSYIFGRHHLGKLHLWTVIFLAVIGCTQQDTFLIFLRSENNFLLLLMLLGHIWGASECVDLYHMNHCFHQQEYSVYFSSAESLSM